MIVFDAISRDILSHLTFSATNGCYLIPLNLFHNERSKLVIFRLIRLGTPLARKVLRETYRGTKALAASGFGKLVPNRIK